MRLLSSLPLFLVPALAIADGTQRPLTDDSDIPIDNTLITKPLFSSLERFARLVDIAYCVGTTGLSHPFSCVSRCKDFPTLELDTTWNTGILMSDSCGFIAVDHSSHHADGPAILVAFRGTYSISNTIVDLSTIPQDYRPYPSTPGDGDDDDDEITDGDGNGEEEPLKCTNCTVHSGFWDSWRNTRKLVLPHLKELRQWHPDYPIHLVGHSLGGAVAALAGLELKTSFGWNNVVVTTFGEPRVGNADLAHYIDRVFAPVGDAQDRPDRWDYRRVTHINDPVPLLPLSEWGFRSHAGEIFISKSELAPEPDDLRGCSGDDDENCSGRNDGGLAVLERLWQLFFAHRDYFWRLGLCVPGGDPFGGGY